MDERGDEALDERGDALEDLEERDPGREEPPRDAGREELCDVGRGEITSVSGSGFGCFVFLGLSSWRKGGPPGARALAQPRSNFPCVPNTRS